MNSILPYQCYCETLIRDLRRDYFKFEGTRRIPTFEYRDLEDFVHPSGEFIIENFREELITYEKPNVESWHISKLVAEHNKPSKRISVAK